MNGLEPLIPVALFFSVTSVIILRGPTGKAITDRIAGRASQMRDGGEEHMDFTERLLTKRGDQSALSGGQ